MENNVLVELTFISCCRRHSHYVGGETTSSEGENKKKKTRRVIILLCFFLILKKKKKPTKTIFFFCSLKRGLLKQKSLPFPNIFSLFFIFKNIKKLLKTTTKQTLIMLYYYCLTLRYLNHTIVLRKFVRHQRLVLP